MRIILLFLLAMLVPAVAASAEALDNRSVVTLVKAGLGDGIIVDKINSMPCGYALATDDLIALKRAGVSETVISAMLRRCAAVARPRGPDGDDGPADPLTPHAPGIYLMQSWLKAPATIGLRPSKPNGVKTTGNGSILFPFMEKMMLAGTTSRVAVRSTSPTFYFYFNSASDKVSEFGMEHSAAAQSPDEFSLARLKAAKDGRELVIGKVSGYGGAAMQIKKGIDSKSAVHFQTEEIAAGTFKVWFDRPLEAGEYAFVFLGANTTARVYEFSVTG